MESISKKFNKNLLYASIREQYEYLCNLFINDEIIRSILEFYKTSEIEGYLGAGCIHQRVWNHILGNDLTFGIDDYDMVYFDSDLSKEKQDKIQTIYNESFPNLNIECTNQARVHLWYESYFGKSIEPIQSVPDGVSKWPTTANSIAIRLQEKTTIEIIAPFGFYDLYSLTLRPNKTQITRDIYEVKVRKWIKKWPQLKVVAW